MKHSESLKQIAPAIVRAQREIGVVVAKSENPFFKSKYADLDACWSVLKEPLQKEGIALVQTLGFIAGAGPTLITTLLHSSGEYISGEQPVCAAKDDPQGMGSAITYARRYGLSAILSLVQVDDDGEGAMNGARQGSGPGLKAVPSEPGSYIIKVGKFKTQRIDKCGPFTPEGIPSDLVNYIVWLRGEAASKSKPLTGDWLELANEVDAYVAFVKSNNAARVK